MFPVPAVIHPDFQPHLRHLPQLRRQLFKSEMLFYVSDIITCLAAVRTILLILAESQFDCRFALFLISLMIRIFSSSIRDLCASMTFRIWMISSLSFRYTIYRCLRKITFACTKNPAISSFKICAVCSSSHTISNDRIFPDHSWIRYTETPPGYRHAYFPASLRIPGDQWALHIQIACNACCSFCRSGRSSEYSMSSGRSDSRIKY